MSSSTKIEWCDSTFNAWIGCTKVSPACDNCYAEADFDLRRHRVKWGTGNPRSRTSADNWKKPLRWNSKPFYDCPGCGWRGDDPTKRPRCPTCDQTNMLKPARRRVFCASLGDVFDNEVPAEWRHDLFNLIRDTPHLDWLLLTKRPQNIVRMVDEAGCVAGNGMRYLPANVWLGASCEDQRRADMNVPALLRAKAATGAKFAFLSMEPLLGPVDLSRWLDIIQYEEGADWMRRNIGHLHDMLDWVVVGGESGPKARPMNPDWAYELRDQCEAAGVPFLFKQWGEWATAGNCAFGTVKGEVRHIRSDGSFWGDDLPEDENADVLTVVKVGKRAAGRLLGGVLHDSYPEAQP